MARVATRALSQRMSDRDADVPSALVDAIAAGQGDRSGVQEQSRRLLGVDPPLDLVLFDTDAIARYVFESSRPPVITGASTILHDLNDKIAEDFEPAVIFSGGGEGLLLVEAGRGREICGEIERLYQSRTEGALTVTTDFLAVHPHQFISSRQEDDAKEGVRVVSGTQAVLSRLRDQIRRRKDERLVACEGIAGHAERCVSCRDRAAGRKTIKDFRTDVRFNGPLCDPCARRWDVGRKRIKGISFEELLGDRDSERSKSRYIGFLYLDGNSMGSLFGSLSSLSDIRFLSQAVRHVFEGLLKRVEKAVRSFAPGEAGTDLPLVSYLGGGDEAIWILPAPLAIAVAEKLSSWITRESEAIPDIARLLRSRNNSPSLTFGAGLVLCGYTYPVRYQYSLAKELQKSAKSMFYRAKGRSPGSSIDFEVLTESSPLSENLEAARALSDRTDEPDFWRSCRPYAADGFSEVLERLRRLRDQDVNLAKSQLYALQDGSREGRRIFLNFLRYQIARKPAGEKYQRWLRAFGVDPADPAAVERFFVRDVPQGSGTWIADGLQLAPFLDRLPNLED
ncbi:MAG TPA: hypothetical protein VGS07_08740 [Thermoanaerobaculia bacterium]|nr:hypothetical protein [Thermoanaerobaculia bacterium]